jgi:hypothetical protein
MTVEGAPARRSRRASAAIGRKRFWCHADFANSGQR